MAVLLGGLLSLFLHPSLQAQLVKGFVLPEYYQPHELDAGQTNRLKGKITGKSAQLLQPSLYLLEAPEITRYAEDARTNLIARSPECILDEKNRTVSSTNRLALEASNGQLLIEGEGYLCYLTNFNLTVSNRVWTLIRQDVLQSTRSTKPRRADPIPKTISGTNGTSRLTTNSPIQIFSDHLDFDYQARVAIYTGHVRVENAQLDLTCDTLTIRRATNGAIESIVAEEDVVIVNKLEHSRATGNWAAYRVTSGEESMVLTGMDAHWQDPQREGRARSFTFDLKNNTVLAEQNAWMKVPRAATNQPDFWMTKSTAATNAATSLTNQFVEISADTLFIELPMTNRPAHKITARTNVLILSPADKSRATSDYAVYSELAGVMELVGHGFWQAGERLAKGDSLFYDRTNRIFRADRNAYLRIPASQLRASAARTSNATKTNAMPKAAVPQFVEVYADNYDLQSGYLTFRDHVRSKLLEGDAVRTALTCDWLSIKMSNQVESASAKGRVFMEQFPAPSTNGTAINKNVKCETLMLTFSTNGMVKKIVADRNVEAHQLETRRDKPPVYSQLNAAEVTAYFFSHTNQVREAVAERDVTIRQNQTTARGEKATYTGTNNWVELTGNPTAEMPEGRITEAEVLVWDRTLEKFFIKKFKARGEGLPAGTNRSNLPSGK